MPSRTVENTYLVEHYRPGLTAEELTTCVVGIRAALRGLEGAAVARFLASVAVPADEAFLLVLGAGSEEEVETTYERIGTTYDRISLALAEVGPLPAARPHTPPTRKGTTP
jgi:hypothetical protein